MRFTMNNNQNSKYNEQKRKKNKKLKNAILFLQWAVENTCIITQICDFGFDSHFQRFKVIREVYGGCDPKR